MTKDHIKEVLDRVLTWPPERQADVVHVVEMMEEQFGSELHLTDEQAAEVRRRLASQVRIASPRKKFSGGYDPAWHEGHVRARRTG